MANDTVKVEIVNENGKDSDKHLDHEIEAIFGKPPNITANTALLNGRNHRNKYIDNNNVGERDSEHPSQPLLEPSRDKPAPPLAGPEIDKLDGDPPKDTIPYTGGGVGPLENTDKKPDGPGQDKDEREAENTAEDATSHVLRSSGDNAGTDGRVPWEHDEPDYPYGDWNTTPNTHSLDRHEDATVRSMTSYANGLSTRFGIDDRAVSPIPGVIPDVNQYQQKKNLAQGMMDLALLSANANQLRYVLESTDSHPYYYSSLTFISLSIIIQVLVGVGLILNSRYDVNNQKDICKADKINNMTVLGIFLITIVNVFITSFSVASPAAISQMSLAGAARLRNST